MENENLIPDITNPKVLLVVDKGPAFTKYLVMPL
jgi:hypothetical protein